MILYQFPEGRNLALTFSYDDGNDCDRRLADLFTDYGMKAAFNLNSANLDRDGKIHGSELKRLFIDRGHEVACHGFEHPFEEKMPLPAVMEDIRKDRLALEKAVGEPVRGFAYPFGTVSTAVKGLLRALGIAYARVTDPAGSVTMIPEDFLEWHPNAHHLGGILALGEDFLKAFWAGPRMLYIWGHASEFDRNKNWHIMEDFCKLTANREEIWYATNIEICDYISAYRNLIFSMDLNMVRNPSAIPVWISVNGQTFRIPSGALVKLS